MPTRSTRGTLLPSFPLSLTTTQGKLLLLIGTLVAAVVSFHLLSIRWLQWRIDGRTFPVWWGVFPTEDFVRSIPFTWPFAVAGFLLGPSFSAPPVPVRWLLLLALLGAVTYGLLTEDVFQEMRGLLSLQVQGVYTRAGMPLLCELLGLLTARLVSDVQQ